MTFMALIEDGTYSYKVIFLKQGYPIRVAFNCLNEVKDIFNSKVTKS